MNIHTCTRSLSLRSPRSESKHYSSIMGKSFSWIGDWGASSQTSAPLNWRVCDWQTGNNLLFFFCSFSQSASKQPYFHAARGVTGPHSLIYQKDWPATSPSATGWHSVLSWFWLTTVVLWTWTWSLYTLVCRNSYQSPACVTNNTPAYQHTLSNTYLIGSSLIGHHTICRVCLQRSCNVRFTWAKSVSTSVALQYFVDLRMNSSSWIIKSHIKVCNE